MKEVIKQNKEWIDSTWEKIDKKMSKVAIKSRNKIPYTTVNGEHTDMSKPQGEGREYITWWTNGFWGGMMWLMYAETKNEEYKKTAERLEEMLNEAFKMFDGLHHDVGFMWHLSSGANYRLTGNRESRNTNFIAAALLASRYNIDGKFIRAWNGEAVKGWTIIDCLMNLSLLYWASEENGDPRFKRIAMSHADMAMRDHIRYDGSVNHIVEHDTETGEVVKVYGGQGYDEKSCWTRGLAWAVYGAMISYIHTKKPEYLEGAKKTADYFISHVKTTDYKTPIDFCSPASPQYYDSTAGVCTACGLLELAKYVDEAEAKVYTDAAIKILKATDENFCDYSDDDDALVKMGSERYPHNEDELKTVHIPIIYGDFFYIEAMTKLRGNDFFIW